MSALCPEYSSRELTPVAALDVIDLAAIARSSSAVSTSPPTATPIMSDADVRVCIVMHIRVISHDVMLRPPSERARS